MANKVTITIDVDPNGTGAKAIRGINADLDKLGSKGTSNLSSATTQAGNLADAFEEIKSAAAVGVIVEFGRQSVLAVAKANDAQRVLNATAIETGRTYDELKKKALDFGRVVGQSDADAQRTFASIVSFVKQADKLENLDKFTKSLTDLAAARGIASSDLPDLVRQLATLQDEATDRLFGANPSAFYDAYAKSIGKTAESLTDAEKRASLLDVTIKKGAIFSGQAEARAKDLSGGIDLLTASLNKFITSAGKTIEGPANSFIGLTSAGLTGQSNPFIEKLLGVTSGAGPGLEQAQGLERAKKIAEDFRKQEQQIRDALANPTGSAGNLALSRIDLTRFTLELDPAKREELLKKGKTEAEKILKDFKGLLEATAKDDKSSVSLLRLALKELNERGGVLGDDQSKIRKSLEDAIEKQVKPALDKVKELGKSSKDFLRDLNLTGNQNPFVRLFSDAEKAAERLREATRGLSKELVEQRAKTQDSIYQRQLNELRFNTNFTALQLRQQGRRLEFGQIGLTGDQERANETLSARLNALLQGGDFLREAERFKRLNNGTANLFGTNETSIKKTLEDVLKLGGLSSPNGAGNDLIQQAILQRIQSLDPNILERSDDPRVKFLRERAAGSLQSRAGFLDEQLRDAVKREEFGQFARKEAEESLKLLKDSTGLDKNFRNKQFLDILGGLNSNELTPELRRGQIDALRQQAEIVERREQEAKQNREEMLTQTRQLNANIEKLITIAQTKGLAQIEVLINNNGDTDITPQLPPSPRPQQTGGIGLYGGNGGLSNR